MGLQSEPNAIQKPAFMFISGYFNSRTGSHLKKTKEQKTKQLDAFKRILSHCKASYDEICRGFLQKLIQKEDEWHEFFQIEGDKGGEFYDKYFPNLTGTEKLQIENVREVEIEFLPTYKLT